MRTKGIGPRGLGASKSPMKMYGAKSPAKQAKAPKGERDLGEGGLKGTTFNQATKIVDEVKTRQDAGQRYRSVSTGMEGVDKSLADNEGYIDRARARAGGGYYKKPGMREAEGNRRMTQRVKLRQAKEATDQRMKEKSSPAKKDPPNKGNKNLQTATTNNAREALKGIGINNPNLTDAQVRKAATSKGLMQGARSKAVKSQSGRNNTNSNK